MKPINNISGTLPNTNRPFEINLKGQNLLIVGGNGAGKTSFLEALFITIRKNIAQGNILHISECEKTIKDMQAALENPIFTEDQRQNFLINLDNHAARLADISDPFKITYHTPKNFISEYKQRTALISIFSANRKASINSVSYASGSKVDINSIKIDENLSTNLEQHLVNLRVRSALSNQLDDSRERAEEIDKWFDSLLKNFRYLFEDESINLKFDTDMLKFKIQQEGKSDYTFQSLSSGYLAIFDIYADLLVRTQYLEVTPEKLSGVVLIDEIDVHLHVSLQRKIFPFLSSSFPNIQFIATTHSPFVVTSIDNALIYDLSTGNESSDMSMFSIDAVVEGLLGVPPVSKQLEETIKKLASITATKKFKLSEAESILLKIEPHVEHLDAESRMYYELAVNKVIKRKAEGV